MDIYTKVDQEGLIADAHIQRLLEWIKEHKNKNIHIWCSERRHKSKEQRAYYRGVILKLISDFTGYTEDEVHEELKKEFLTEGEVVKSTESLDSIETQQYHEKIRRTYALRGCWIPEPNESYHGYTE